jgi:subtilase family serine protease
MLAQPRSFPHRPRRSRPFRALAISAAAAATLVLGGCQAGHLGAGTAAATATGPATASPPGGALFDCLTAAAPPICYGVRQFLVAYGIQPLLDRGINGRGETVVLPEPAQKPAAQGVSDVRQDLALFDRLFGLPAARLQVITRLAGAASPYLSGNEEAGDAEMVHAVAPGAAIRVILLPAFSGSAQTVITAYAEALRLAPAQGAVVSISAGLGERCFTSAEVTALNSALQADRRRHVTVIAGSGDNGAAIAPCPGTGASVPLKGVNLPASDPLVLAVGGTSLEANHTTGAYLGETAWNTPLPANPPLPPGDQEPPVASSGGFSSIFPRPSYQAGVAAVGSGRGVPDVAADAGPATGMSSAFDMHGGYIIGPADGTSAGSPFWAGIVALADQYAGRHLGFINPAVYRIGRSSSYHSAFHDVTTGDNTVKYPQGTVTGYSAAIGWDPVTGWGSPSAQVLVPLLALYTRGRQ